MISVLRKYVSLLLLLLLMGCAANRPTVFFNPEYDFAGIERIAVVPFDNLTTDQGMGDYTMRIFITELLATNAFDIVEPGEISRYLTSKGITKTSELTLEQMQELATKTNVQAIVFGTIGESTQFRSGNLSSHVISMDVRLVSVETGTTVWSAAVNSGGPGFFARLLGLGEQTRGNAIRSAVKKSVKSLVK